MRDLAHTRPALPGPGAEHAYGPRLVLHSTPSLLSILARLGSPDASQPEVGRLATRCFDGLFSAVVDRELAWGVARVPTRMSAAHPGHAYEGVLVARDQRVVVADVARAGIVPSQLFFDRLHDLVDPAHLRQDHLFVSRRVDADGRVTGAAVAAAKIGGPVDDALLVLPDPMGATGGSLLEVLDHYAAYGVPRRVVVVHLIVTPEYVRRVLAARDDVVIHAIRLDRGFSSAEALAAPPGTHTDERGLDGHQYVVPGAGGLGEVLNNAWV
jgi:uracil phosphoribosyltransferase